MLCSKIVFTICKYKQLFEGFIHEIHFFYLCKSWWMNECVINCFCNQIENFYSFNSLCFCTKFCRLYKTVIYNYHWCIWSHRMNFIFFKCVLDIFITRMVYVFWQKRIGRFRNGSSFLESFSKTSAVMPFDFG